ncbi:MAG: HD-like signal output (HDOD) protein [Planctomycetota bacterium]|jgi:HD-like signal output (HDOD) protein
MNLTRMQAITDGIRNLQPWPPVSIKVLNLSREPDVVPADLVGVLQTDAAMTARVLKLCNSAFYGFHREVDSLHEAANRLGVGALVSLVLTSCVGKTFTGAGKATELAGKQLWERSVMNALSASLLASVHGEVDPNTCYTAALMQNFGYQVIHSSCQEALPMIANAKNEGATDLEAEKEVLGLHHAQIGGRLARRWEFPDVLVDTILNHHTPERSKAAPKVTAISHMAEEITNALAQGEGLNSMSSILSGEAMGLTGFTLDGLCKLEESLNEELNRARELIVQV